MACSAARNAFEVLSKLPNHGIGAKLAKKTWQEGSFYTVTKIKLSQDGAHGKVYGVLTWNGNSADPRVLRINGPLKKTWRVHGSQQTLSGGGAAAAVLRQESAAKEAAAPSEELPSSEPTSA